MKKGKKRKIIIGSIMGVVIVLGGLLAYLTLGNQSTAQYTEAKPTMGSIVNDNRFTGVIETRARGDVMAVKSQEIYDLYASEGDQVEEGTDLYETYTGEVVSATINGEVSKIYYHVDDTVPAGEKVMDIADYTNLQVTIKVDEYQLSSINVGSPVTVNVDSIGRSVQGTVSEISREAKNENSVAYFTAIVDFQGDSAIRVGMNAEVVIVKASVDNALIIPMEAIQFRANNESFVMVKNTSGKLEERNVITGISDGVHVQITEGLTDADTVMIPKAVASATTAVQGPGFGGGN